MPRSSWIERLGFPSLSIHDHSGTEVSQVAVTLPTHDRVGQFRTALIQSAHRATRNFMTIPTNTVFFAARYPVRKL